MKGKIKIGTSTFFVADGARAPDLLLFVHLLRDFLDIYVLFMFLFYFRKEGYNSFLSGLHFGSLIESSGGTLAW